LECASKAVAGELPLFYDKEDTSAGRAEPALPEFSALPSIPHLPDPFTKADGSRTTTREEWRTRRAEIKRCWSITTPGKSRQAEYL